MKREGNPQFTRPETDVVAAFATLRVSGPICSPLPLPRSSVRALVLVALHHRGAYALEDLETFVTKLVVDGARDRIREDPVALKARRVSGTTEGETREETTSPAKKRRLTSSPGSARQRSQSQQEAQRQQQQQQREIQDCCPVGAAQPSLVPWGCAACRRESA